MTHNLTPVSISFGYLMVNVAILSVILALNHRAGSRPHQTTPPSTEPPGEGHLDPSNILEWEFEYARTTASEALGAVNLKTNRASAIIRSASSR